MRRRHRGRSPPSSWSSAWPPWWSSRRSPPSTCSTRRACFRTRASSGRRRPPRSTDAVLRFRVYAPPERADAMRSGLAPLPGVRHLIVGGETAGGLVELTGDIDTEAADVVLGLLRGYELGPLPHRHRARRAATRAVVDGAAHAARRP